MKFKVRSSNNPEKEHFVSSIPVHWNKASCHDAKLLCVARDKDKVRPNILKSILKSKRMKNAGCVIINFIFSSFSPFYSILFYVVLYIYI